MNYRDYLQKVIYKVIDPMIKGIIRIGLTPNIITTIGFVLNIVAAVIFIVAADSADSAYCLLGWGGGLLLFAGLFDMMDGRLARMGNLSSTFGALWDSTLDRYSELLSLFGVACFLQSQQNFTAFVITFVAMIGSVMVSYVRARAEGLNIDCKVGLLQRPERVVLTSAGALLSGIFTNVWFVYGAMIIIAVLANITAFWRLIHCYNELKDKK